MEFIVKSGNPDKQRTACIVVGIFEPRRLSLAAEILDSATEKLISTILRRGDIEGKAGQTLLIHNHSEKAIADRLLLVGCGREREFGESQYNQTIISTVSVLNEIGAMDASLYLPELHVRGRETSWKIRQAVVVAESALYRFEQMKSKPSNKRRPLRRLALHVPSRKELPEAESAAKEGIAVAAGISLARDLGNLPGNICTPTYLAERASKMASEYQSINCEIIEQAEMERLGMGALLSVARGSRQPPKLIKLHYQGSRKKSKPYVLVGKGLTFDAGGISLKPAAGMDEMKYDMCGAAAVFGTLLAAAMLELPINIIGLVPSSENLPDGNANKPGDIVTSLSGQTIEILNTDAEGRLILCDTLTYAKQFSPETVIDIATLTGACVVALGGQAAGLLGNHSPLVKELLSAGRESGDRAWELPLWEEYQEQLKSPFADMANVGGKEAGTITAACFLSRFTRKMRWAHLDIAGVAWKGGKEKGATGRPVALLTRYLINRSQAIDK
jgi:leucyl aminopeptidase